MGRWDSDDEENGYESLISDDYKPVNANPVLENSEEALSLVSKILGIKKERLYQKKLINRLDSLIDKDFLASLKGMHLSDEAKIQLQLAKISDKLSGQRKYEIIQNRPVIGVGGKFSAGKSKFLNAILNNGEELLPESQNPTTSIPTYIGRGKQEEIKAYTTDGNEVVINVQEMQALTHAFFEKYRMGFSSFISSLIVLEPAFPFESLMFLDTPGYSKADETGVSQIQKELSDRNKAYEQLSKVDYLIWLVDIENGVLSDQDIDFILNVGLSTPILIVANKVDKKERDEIPELLRTFKESAQNAGISLYAVTAYSSRDKKEWDGQHIIEDYLQYAVKHPTNQDDVFTQINNIDRQITGEIEESIKQHKETRNYLSRVIYKSNNILEIKTLVNLYGEIMKSIRIIRECSGKYQKIFREITKELNKYFNR